MFSEIKRLFKHSIIYGIGHFLTRFVGFALLPVYSNFLTTSKFGDYALIFTFLGFANVIYILGFDSSFLRYFLLEKGDKEKKQIFSTAFISLLISSLIFSVIVNLFSDWFSQIFFHSSEYYHFFKWSSGILFFDTISVLGFLVLRAEERSISFVSVRLINVFLTIILNIFFVIFLKWNVEGIIISNFIASFVTFLILIPVITSNFKFTFSTYFSKELFSFGLPYIIPGLALISMELIGIIFIENLIGKEQAGIYRASYKLAIAISIIVAAYRFAWQPFFLSIAKNEHAKEIYARVLTYFLLFISWFYLFISLFVIDLVHIKIGGYSFLGSEYWGGVKIVPVVMLSYIFYGLYVNFIVGIYIEKKSIYLPYITGISALVNIVLNFILIPPNGIMGAAISSAVSYFVMAMLLFFIAKKYYPITYEYVRIIKIVLITGLCFFIGYWGYEPFQPYLKIIVFLLFPFLLRFIGFFNKEEIKKLKEMYLLFQKK
jgi:O-antigen/teichoic acid export membrane protein